jgi:ferrous iron transport protein B
MQAALTQADNPGTFHPRRPEIRLEHRPVFQEILTRVAGHVPSPYPEEWTALKLLEGDAEITALIRKASPPAYEQVLPLLMQHEDAYLDFAGGRYEWVGRMMRAAVVRPRAGAVTLTDRLDRVATHPFLGVVLLLGIFGLVFWMTYALALPLVASLDSLIGG